MPAGLSHRKFDSGAIDFQISDTMDGQCPGKSCQGSWLLHQSAGIGSGHPAAADRATEPIHGLAPCVYGTASIGVPAGQRVGRLAAVSLAESKDTEQACDPGRGPARADMGSSGTADGSNCSSKSERACTRVVGSDGAQRNYLPRGSTAMDVRAMHPLVNLPFGLLGFLVGSDRIAYDLYHLSRIRIAADTAGFVGSHQILPRDQVRVTGCGHVLDNRQLGVDHSIAGS